MFEPGLVELAVDFDRLAPQKDAAAERLGEMEAVPAVQYAPPAGGEHDRHYRYAGEPRDIDNAGAGVHRRAARPVRSNADAGAGGELLQHQPQCPGAAAPARPRDRLDTQLT